MTDWRSLFEKKYIGSWDIPEGRDVVVIIDRVKGGELTMAGGVKNKKPLIYFRNVKDPSKPMAAGATVCKTISKLLGTNDVEQWAGKSVVLYRTTTENSEGTIDCIRVRPYPPKSKPEAVPAPEPAAAEREPGEEAAG